MGESGGPGYRAFISYSHRDAGFGRGLHRRLEGYRLPRRLVGRPTPRGPAPRRLAPIFRDRDELPAAHDLTTEVRAALAASEALVVVCSPNARASPWVAREIEVFRSLHPDRPVLAALVEGDPADAFPEPLRRAGALDVEPLAADFRKVGDGPRLALLKLIAGVSGVGLDQLVQRDAQRRVRSVTAVTAGALTLAVGMGGLAAFALQQRAEAEAQRAEAEGLIEFMLTDLRLQLKGVGRLDALTGVNRRAFAYYEAQDLTRLPPDSLARRARILHAMGEDDMTLGHEAAAAQELEEAHRTTAVLLSVDPGDPERIWSHAQSAFWRSMAELDAGRLSAARAGFLEYRRLSEQLVQRGPGNWRYLRELGYAEGNLCTLAMRKPRDPPEALRSCAAAISWMEAALRAGGPATELKTDLVNRHAWMADAYELSRNLAGARAHRLKQQLLLESLLAADPQNMKLKLNVVALQRAMARLARKEGRRGEARRHLTQAAETLEQMLRFEPRNETWRSVREKLQLEQATLEGGCE